MRGFGSIEAASRFCHAFEEVRYWFRPRQRMKQVMSLADKRRLFSERFEALNAMLIAA
jgi:putative transposase